MRIQSLVTVVASVPTIIAACGTTAIRNPATDDGALGVPSGDEMLGMLSYGQTSPLTLYTSTPRYRAYWFQGGAADDVDIIVHSDSGVPDAWLLTSTGTTIAWNFATQHDAHITQPLAADGTYFIVFREASFGVNPFTVSLAKVITIDSGLDAAPDTVTDVTTDVSSDGFDSAVDASSNVTCTFTRTLPSVSGCSTCVLPTTASITENNVPIYVTGSGGYMCQSSGPRAVDIHASTIFYSTNGWTWGGNPLQIADPSDAGTASCVIGPTCWWMTNGSCSIDITVAGNSANISLDMWRLPADAPPCAILHGCVREEVVCSGTATF